MENNQKTGKLLEVKDLHVSFFTPAGKKNKKFEHSVLFMVNWRQFIQARLRFDFQITRNNSRE